MSKVKRFLMNRVENFKQASSFGKVWRITVYFVLVTVLVGPFLPAEEQAEPVAQEPVTQENPTSEEWRQDQVKAAQEQAAKEKAAKEQAEKKEAARKAKVEASKTPEQEIEESLKDSLGDQYRASEITKKPGGYDVFVKFDAADNLTSGMIKRGILIDAKDAVEAVNENVVSASFNAYLPAADGGDDLFVMGGEKVKDFDAVVDHTDAWEIGMIHPDLQ